MRTIILSALAYAIYKAYTSVKNLSVSMEGVRFVGMRQGHIALQVGFVVANPTIASCTVQHIVGSLYIQDVNCGTVNQYYKAGKIPAHAVTTIPVELLVNPARLAESVVANIMSGDVSTLTVRFQGEVIISGARIPLNINLNWEDIKNV